VPSMKRICLSLAVVLAACGGATPSTNTAEPTNAAAPAPAPPKAAEPESKPAAAATNEAAVAPVPPAPEPVAEKCEAGWVCVKVSFDTKKVEPRATKLLGDPKIEQTWSKNIDGRPATFDAFSKGAVELTLRRRPGNKNEVVVKLAKGGEIVIDRHDGSIDDFTHVGAIAAEQGGALLVDLRYMK
jgi:hypothetical protein